MSKPRSSIYSPYEASETCDNAKDTNPSGDTSYSEVTPGPMRMGYQGMVKPSVYCSYNDLSRH